MNFQRGCTLLLTLVILLMCSGCGSTVEAEDYAAAVTEYILSDSADATDFDGSIERSVSVSEDAAEADKALRKESEGKTVSVSTVDEFLFALADNTEIVFAPGEYDLTTASDYGRNTFSDFYLWEEVFDGYQLVIHGVSDLVIRSDSAGETSVVTNPRYANIFSFDSCSEVTVEGLTLGHSIEPGQCVGGVVFFYCTDGANVNCCRLYGCGVTGIRAIDSCSITARDTEIYNCSDSAACADSCFDFVLEGCSVHDCPGEGRTQSCYSLFDMVSCSGFVVTDCNIFNNAALCFLNSYRGSQATVLGCSIEDNYFDDSIFCCTGLAPIVDGCRIGRDQLSSGGLVYARDGYSESLHAFDTKGNELDAEDLYEMEPESISYLPSDPVLSDGYAEQREVHADTVDEFLDAIAPNTTIYLNEGEYILSEASDYGKGGSSYYYWESCLDGWSLVIHDVDNLNIRADGPLSTSILSDCINAEVISFNSCTNSSISGFTLGHDSMGYACTGGVIRLFGCDGILIDSCRLFGCGIMGISANNCGNVKVNYCEIYDCSDGALELNNTDLLEATDCRIHDCGAPTIYVSGNSLVSINGNEYSAGYYTMQDSGSFDISTMWAT